MNVDIKLLAAEWIAYWKKNSDGAEHSDSSLYFVLDDLVRESPEACLDVVMEILKSIEPKPENPLFQVLAAGLLEDLLGDNPTLIGRVEALAAANEPFNLLLGGVWQGGMTPEVWARIQQCRRTIW